MDWDGLGEHALFSFPTFNVFLSVQFTYTLSFLLVELIRTVTLNLKKPTGRLNHIRLFGWGAIISKAKVGEGRASSEKRNM